jgi:diphosphomevalonate decarboxylase
VVAKAAKKDVPSTAGMDRSVATSEFMKARLRVVEDRVETMCSAIRRRDFAEFARLTMIESNSLHAVCLDSYPPICYMNEVSFKVVALIHALNQTAVTKCNWFC